ncbi:lecithin retinol acyltransferase-like [Scleropages formosus]|uniref:Lecithin retinol acyltransferase n=1 Tax=Scleropages formosus TaxID=113540 RepID=A0A8C9VVU1_SCLFO|nr:lecithin retinol acyltransferase-like [Scleropages formosus]
MLELLTFLLEKISSFVTLSLFSFLSSGQSRCPPRCYESSSFQRGDLLEVPRTLFTHFGIYLGDNKVAHLMPDIMPVVTSDRSLIDSMVTNRRLLLGVLCKRASVRVDTVEDFAYGSPVLRGGAERARKSRALEREEAAQRAEELVGNVPYSLLWYNCEHFATYCRYGAASSFQTDRFCECLKSVIRDQRSLLFSLLLGMMFTIYHGLTPTATLPAVIIPFILWMVE